MDRFLEKQSDGLLHWIWFVGQCKTGNCKGEVRVFKAHSNEEGIAYVGYCNKNRPQHRYSFDKTELTGEPVTLTPKKDPPENNV